MGLSPTLPLFLFCVKSHCTHSFQHHTQKLCWGASMSRCVEVQQCNVTENSHYQYLNTNSVDCAFSIDGTILNATRVDREKPPKHLFARRCYQQAGLCDITCLNCGKIEETGVKFKKCGTFEGVVYCGRECQKAHWKEHKKECEKLKDFWKDHTMKKVLPKRANP